MQKKKIGRLTLSDFDNYNKATVIKRVYIAIRKDRLMQWKKESRNRTLPSHLIFAKSAKGIQKREEDVLNKLLDIWM